MAKKQIRVNGFEMATPGHHSHGIWHLPGHHRANYHDIDYWIDIARTAEKGLFDALFLADVVGTYATYNGSRDAAIRTGMQVPNLDPTILIGIMAAVTEHLGFAVTGTTTYEAPFGWARRFSTLDHVTRGRFAWNVVTGYLPDAAYNYGLDEQIKHDNRYELAEEFIQVIYELLESSWDDDAVIKDPKTKVYADPSRVREIGFEGDYFRVAGPHLTEPSPQRTPVIYQAGTSDRGKRFAARHAEGTFLVSQNREQARKDIEDLRRLTEEAGRKPNDIKAFLGVEIITGRNQEEVDAQLKLIKDHRDIEGHLAFYAGASGNDIGGTDTDRYLEYKGRDAVRTLEKFWTDGDERKTIDDLIDYYADPTNNKMTIAGTPDKVANWLEELIDYTDADGINLIQHFSPGTFRDFAEFIVPELQQRGRYRTAYRHGETLRERLYDRPGQKHALPGHPAAKLADARRARQERSEAAE